MRLPPEIKEKATRLREKGYSIKEIAKILGIAVGTSSVWLREVEISEEGQERLKGRKLLKYYKSSFKWQEKRDLRDSEFNLKAANFLNLISFDKNISKLICALLIWTEGEKTDTQVRFINSDPRLIEVFMKFFRESFEVKEEKLRVKIHIHEYHNESELRQFWSKTSGISLSQFTKSYLKPHTSKRIKENYMGCVCISYYDCTIAREINAIYNSLAGYLRV